jgi:hypothetical protein
MSISRAFLCGLTLVGATAVVTTQVVSQDAAPEPATWQQYAVPSNQHDILDRLAGKWDHHVTVWESPGAEPEAFDMTTDYRWMLGGRFLLGTYRGYVAGEYFEDRDLRGYDNFRQQFNSVWMDNKSTAFTLSSGRYDQRQDALILEGTQDDVARKVRDEPFRFVYRFASDDRIEIDVLVPGPQGKMFRRIRVEATRIE